ncbi:hypothetical protein AXF42_Ash019440 [Apostasia shenzhenica]|uniref:Uncharacterized protein n=1 Tax=Apostasia shenzhenica TaxID=1088818 RepID=A0A2I0AYB7_9ASPA|nr:hypothetical protein AXF42_Ash019440 [Apostasia shenzhenica]
MLGLSGFGLEALSFEPQPKRPSLKFEAQSSKAYALSFGQGPSSFGVWDLAFELWASCFRLWTWTLTM